MNFEGIFEDFCRTFLDFGEILVDFMRAKIESCWHKDRIKQRAYASIDSEADFRRQIRTKIN